MIKISLSYIRIFNTSPLLWVPFPSLECFISYSRWGIEKRRKVCIGENLFVVMGAVFGEKCYSWVSDRMIFWLFSNANGHMRNGPSAILEKHWLWFCTALYVLCFLFLFLFLFSLLRRIFCFLLVYFSLFSLMIYILVIKNLCWKRINWLHLFIV